MKLIVSFIVVSFMVISMGACMSKSNFREFVKGNINATGALYRDKKAKYYNIHIGNSENPFNCTDQLFSIKLTNGDVFNSNELILSKVITLATFTREYNSTESGWDTKIKQYSFEGYTFIYIKEKLVQFRMTWIKLPDKIVKPKIGAFDTNVFYELPIKQTDLEKIFGKPDKVVDSFRW